MEVALRDACECLATFSAPDWRLLLLVLGVGGVEFGTVIELFAACAALEGKLLLYEILVRLGALSLGGFHLLPRPMIIRGVKVFRSCGWLIVINPHVKLIITSTSDLSKFPSIPAVVNILIFREVDQVFTPSFEIYFRPLLGKVDEVFELSFRVVPGRGWDREVFEYMRSVGVEITRRTPAHLDSGFRLFMGGLKTIETPGRFLGKLRRLKDQNDELGPSAYQFHCSETLSLLGLLLQLSSDKEAQCRSGQEPESYS